MIAHDLVPDVIQGSIHYRSRLIQPCYDLNEFYFVAVKAISHDCEGPFQTMGRTATGQRLSAVNQGSTESAVELPSASHQTAGTVLLGGSTDSA